MHIVIYLIECHCNDKESRNMGLEENNNFTVCFFLYLICEIYFSFLENDPTDEISNKIGT